jgi:polysaccharide deacetylase family protein (PEP-CTERM system associated)
LYWDHGGRLKNVFTVDLEDWFDGLVPTSQHAACERRIRCGFDKLMSLLDRYNTKATFFVLGRILKEDPAIIRELLSMGHELASHANEHTPLYEMAPEGFAKDVAEWKRVADAEGFPYAGFRAPYFSVDHRSTWALDILADAGFLFDSSIFSGNNWRTGIQGYRKDAHILRSGLLELPITTFTLFGLDGGLGGAYFRLLPYSVFKKCFQRCAEVRPAIFYMHPWELDDGQPHPKGLTARKEWPHYYDLKGTHAKLERLLGDFEFGSVAEVFGTAISGICPPDTGSFGQNRLNPAYQTASRS